MINPPIYPPFYHVLDEVGAIACEVPLAHDADQGWRLDLGAMEDAFAKRPAAYVLCNPQPCCATRNPVSRAHRPDELLALVELATRYDVRIVSNEIHAPLVLPGAALTPLLTAPGAAAVAISLLSAGKAWNLAGLKCAAMVTASQDMRDVVAKRPTDARWRIGHFEYSPPWPVPARRSRLTSGSGLVGLTDRVEALGARLCLHSPPGAASTIGPPRWPIRGIMKMPIASEGGVDPSGVDRPVRGAGRQAAMVSLRDGARATVAPGTTTSKTARMRGLIGAPRRWPRQALLGQLIRDALHD